MQRVRNPGPSSLCPHPAGLVALAVMTLLAVVAVLALAAMLARQRRQNRARPGVMLDKPGSTAMLSEPAESRSCLH